MKHAKIIIYLVYYQEKKTLKEKNIVILRHWWGCTLYLIIYSDCLELVWIIFSQKSRRDAMKRLCRGELPSHKRMDSVADSTQLMPWDKYQVCQYWCQQSNLYLLSHICSNISRFSRHKTTGLTVTTAIVIAQSSTIFDLVVTYYVRI